MNNIYTTFSINDLENISGVKAHTIRAWERRYDLLHPDRTEGNQRNYSIDDLRRLLNIKLLTSHGYKISKVASYAPSDLSGIVHEVAKSETEFSYAVDRFKLAMLAFDPMQFEKVYRELTESMDFTNVFVKVFIPLLNEIGLLWQVDTINPAHEHFISSLIQQKIMANIDGLPGEVNEDTSRIFALYLPEHEIHDLGLLFLHYEFLRSGMRSIYLGHSVPIDNLARLMTQFDHITFVSYFTIEPKLNRLSSYLTELRSTLLSTEQNNMWMVGRKTGALDVKDLSDDIIPFLSVIDLLESPQFEKSIV